MTEQAGTWMSTEWSECELKSTPPKSPVTEKLIQDLQDRTKIGYSKYGRVLDKGIGKPPLSNLKEELLDGLQYLEQHLMEEKELWEVIDQVCYAWVNGSGLIDPMAKLVILNSQHRSRSNETHAKSDLG